MSGSGSKTGTLPPPPPGTGPYPVVQAPAPSAPSFVPHPHPQGPHVGPHPQSGAPMVPATPSSRPDLVPQSQPRPHYPGPQLPHAPGLVGMTPQAPGAMPMTSQMPAQPMPAMPPRITVQYPQVGAMLSSNRGAYVVRSIVGSGEFGAVYDCVGPFDQAYAVKMIRPANRPYAEVHAEWAREVQRLMSLRHPNVVYIFDAFEQGHLFYCALERCDHPLTAMLGTPMQEGLVIELGRQLLAAVQFLHDNDIVHDDLHPGNVLITHADRPIVKISDFGISHELRGMPAIRPNVVHHKIMAPEVVATGYTSKQSDLYQVGLLLFWMVTGRPAIPVGISYQELVRQVSDGGPRARAEEIGTPLGGLIAKMLRRREAYRYTQAKEVWADLRELPAWQNRNLFREKS